MSQTGPKTPGECRYGYQKLNPNHQTFLQEVPRFEDGKLNQSTHSARMGTNRGCIPLFRKYPKQWQGGGTFYTVSGVVVTVIHVQKVCPHH